MIEVTFKRRIKKFKPQEVKLLVEDKIASCRILHIMPSEQETWIVNKLCPQVSIFLLPGIISDVDDAKFEQDKLKDESEDQEKKEAEVEAANEDLQFRFRSNIFVIF